MLCPMQNGKSLLKLQLKNSCRQKPAKNPMQKLPKKPTKILYRQKSFMSDKLSRQFFGQKLLQSFNIILTKNLLRYPKNY